jgi:hypothetical protein
MLSKNDFLRNMISDFPFPSTQVLEEFCIGKYLLDGIKEWEVDFYLFEDLHHILYFLSLFSEVRRCLETFWEWDPGLIWYLRSGSR